MVSYGFYDSKDHDRRYNALQFSSLFDGIIRDGIFMSIGTCFRVTASDPPNLKITVGAGRAWFNHTWTWNDAPIKLNIPQPELLLSRIDAVIIEVNRNELVRANAVKIIKGTPSKSPTPPTLVKGDNDVYQYPLAYISVDADATYVRQADITNMVGTPNSPFVTGILDTVDTSMLLSQWEDQWLEFKEDTETEWSTWFDTTTQVKLEQIDRWFNTVKDTLGEDSAVGLANAIYDLTIKTEIDILNLQETINNEIKVAMNQMDQRITEVKNSIPPATRVKGNAESAYRTGNVNLTPENIGALNLRGNAGNPITGAIYINHGKPIIYSGGSGECYIEFHSGRVSDQNYKDCVGFYLLNYPSVDAHLSRDNRGIFAFRPAWHATGATVTDLGTNNYRWRNVYAANSSIVTSDERLKKDIEDFDETFVKDFIMSIRPVSFKMKDGTSGRTHYGMIAQEIEEMFEKLGMDSLDFAGFIKSPGVDSPDGKKSAYDYIYSLRYEEFISPMIKMIQIQQKEIDELRKEVEELKQKVK